MNSDLVIEDRANARAPETAIVFGWTICLALAALPLIFSLRFWPGHSPIKDPAGEQQWQVLLLQLCVVLASGLFSTHVRRWGVKPIFALALVPLAIQGWHTLVHPQPTSIGSLIRWTVLIAFGTALYSAIVGGRIRLTSRAVALTIAGAALAYLLLFVLVYSDAAERAELGGSVIGFGNVRYTGYFAAPAAAILLSLSVGGARRPIGAIGAFAAAALIFAFTFYTGTRATIFSVGVTALVLTIVSPRLHLWWLVLAFAATLVLGYYIAAVLPEPAGPQYLIAERMQRFENIDSGRLRIWSVLFDQWLTAPIFGLGEMSVGLFLRGWLGQAHNSVLQLLLSVGVVGSVAVWTLVALLFRRMFDAVRRKSKEALPAIAGIVCLFAHSLVDGPLFYAYPLALCAALVAAFLAESGRHQELGDR